MSSPSMTINVISSNNEPVPTPNENNVIIIPPPSGSSSSNSNGVVLPPSLVLPPNMDASNFGILDSNNGNDAETYTSTASPTLPPTTKSIPLPPPTSAPIAAMTSIPTKTPTESPKTFDPTKLPTKEPTFSPTISPITKPPKKDTNEPTFSTNSVYPKYWFEYNPLSDFGPYEWDKVDLGNENLYLNYIMDDTNECDKDNEQSPINIRADDQCKDDHTPAQERGKTKFNELKFEIESSGLRAILGDGNNNDGDDNPRADFSNLSEFVPASFVNVKTPSEHHLYGKSYAGEFQIYHYWDKGNGRFIVISVLMDDSENKEHAQLEMFLREWEEVSYEKKNKCDRKLNPNSNIPVYSRSYPISSNDEMYDIWGVKGSNEKSDYDIYKFMTSGWYCGYDGSITEPPCSRRVHWRVLDVPMKVSKAQIQRIEYLILNRLNDDCQLETAAFDSGVNRPIQKNTNSGDESWCCTSFDWKFREGKDPMYWLDSWDDDYHGWEKIEKYKSPLH